MSNAQSEDCDFSLVLGGPLYRLFIKAGLSTDASGLVGRRMVAISLITWLPLLLLTAIEGTALGGPVGVPFLRDIEVHVRFLLSLPILIYAELFLHRRMRYTFRQFLDGGLVPDAQRARFEADLSSAVRLRNSALGEALLLLFVYVMGVGFLWERLHPIHTATWFATPVDGHLQFSLSGRWFLWVSLPVFQFVLLRWFYRLLIWGRLLWQISRLELRLIPTHPDHAGGLGFLGNIAYYFSIVVAAQGAQLAGTIANRIFHDGAKLTEFTMEIAVMIAFLSLVVLGPFLFFIPQMAHAKRKGRREYGMLSQRFVQDFDEKWVHGEPGAGERLLGSRDLQSLAGLKNSYQIVLDMRIVPVSRDKAIFLAVMAVLPISPLLLTMIPLDEILQRLLKALF